MCLWQIIAKYDASVLQVVSGRTVGSHDYSWMSVTQTALWSHIIAPHKYLQQGEETFRQLSTTMEVSQREGLKNIIHKFTFIQQQLL